MAHSISERPSLLIWDYDGTLAPSFAQIVPSFQAAFEYGLDRIVPPEEIVSWFGPTDEEVIRRRVPQERFPVALRIFYERYRQLQNEASLFDAVRHFLETSSRQVQHALVTNKGRMTTMIAVKAQGLQHVFSAVVTGDDVDQPKPAPEGIWLVLNALKATPHSAIYLGDSPTDVEAAKQAGMRVAAVGYGGIHSPHALKALEPTWVIEDPHTLSSWWTSLL